MTSWDDPNSKPVEDIRARVKKIRDYPFGLPIVGKEEPKQTVVIEGDYVGPSHWVDAELKQIGPRYNISSMWILDHDEGSHRRIIAGKEYIFRWVILDRVTTIVVSKREPGACTWSVEHVVEFPRKKS